MTEPRAIHGVSTTATHPPFAYPKHKTKSSTGIAAQPPKDPRKPPQTRACKRNLLAAITLYLPANDQSSSWQSTKEAETFPEREMQCS